MFAVCFNFHIFQFSRFFNNFDDFLKNYILVHFWNGVRKPFSTAGTPPRLQPSAIE